MKKAWALMGALFIASLPGLSAAQTTARSAVVESLNTILDTFSSDSEALYDCCGGLALNGKHVGSMQYLGVPFTPAADSHIRRIILGVSIVSGTNEMVVTLRADAGGLPGKELGHFKVTGLDVFGNCCEPESVRAKGIPVTAGTPYWVVLKPAADAYASWNYNVIGASGRFARRDEAGWSGVSGTLPAVRILGD